MFEEDHPGTLWQLIDLFDHLEVKPFDVDGQQIKAGKAGLAID